MDFKQKLEPRGRKVLHGAGQSPETFKMYWNAVGKNKPVIYMTYIKLQSIDKWIDTIEAEIIPYPKAMLQIGLNFRIDHEDGTRNISEGKHDNILKKLAKKIKSLKRNTFIRLGYEFDAPGRYKPQTYAAAFRYVVKFFQNEKVKNVAYVWCSCPYKGTENFEPYYPGDDYVDWFGMDIFGAQLFAEKMYEPIERFLAMAIEHKKPVMIGESSAIKIGIENGEQIWREWFAPYFKLIKTHSEIKAFCYINWDWGKDWKTPRWMNARIEENEEVRRKYVKELNNPIYIHCK